MFSIGLQAGPCLSQPALWAACQLGWRQASLTWGQCKLMMLGLTAHPKHTVTINKLVNSNSETTAIMRLFLSHKITCPQVNSHQFKQICLQRPSKSMKGGWYQPGVLRPCLTWIQCNSARKSMRSKFSQVAWDSITA